MICIISDFSYPVVGGTEKHVFELASHLSKKEKVMIISPVWGDEKKEYSFKNITIKKFKLPLRRSLMRVAYYLLWLVKYGHKAKTINTHYLLPGVAGIIYAKLTGKKVYATIHDFENIERGFPNNLFVKTLNKADKVIATSHYLKNRMMANGIKSNKIVVLPNWVKTKKKNTSKKPIILFVGRIIKEKGVDILIKSIKKVNKKMQYYFTGKEFNDEFRKLAEQEGVSKQCTFTGFVSKEKLEELYKNCTALVLPSIKLEGFGFVLVEAMKYGKPVIGSDIGGVPETIGKAGLLIKPGSVDSLSNALNKLLNNKVLYNKLSSEAIKQVSKFDQKKVLNAYEKLLSA